MKKTALVNERLSCHNGMVGRGEGDCGREERRGEKFQQVSVSLGFKCQFSLSNLLLHCEYKISYLNQLLITCISQAVVLFVSSNRWPDNEILLHLRF